jgi:hypothetical protein
MTTTTTTTTFQSVLDDWAPFYHREGLSVIIPLKSEPALDRKKDVVAGALPKRPTLERGAARLAAELAQRQQKARKPPQEVTMPQEVTILL